MKLTFLKTLHPVYHPDSGSITENTPRQTVFFERDGVEMEDCGEFIVIRGKQAITVVPWAQVVDGRIEQDPRPMPTAAEPVQAKKGKR